MNIRILMRINKQTDNSALHVKCLSELRKIIAILFVIIIRTKYVRSIPDVRRPIRM